MSISHKQTGLTDEQIIHMFDVYSSINGPVVDEDNVEYLVFTRDTLEEFMEARKQWSVRGELDTRTEKSITILGCQGIKGDRRKDLHIVDFGEFRMICED